MKVIIGWIAIALGGWSLLPSSAEACSCSSSAIDNAEPADGAIGVALNKALELLGAFEPDSISFEDASGQAVEFTLTAGPTPSCAGTSASVVPKHPLRPQTTYIVRVKALYPDSESGPDSVTFTTGTALLPDDELQTPEGTASVVFDVPPDGFSCGSGTVAACVGVQSDSNIEVMAIRDDEAVLRWVLRRSNGGAFKLFDQPGCIELRRLSLTGRRSVPLRICGDALRSREFVASDRDSGFVSCSQGVIGRSGPTVDGPPDGGATTLTAAEQRESELGSATGSDDDTLMAPGSMERGCSLVSEGALAPSGALLASIALIRGLGRRRARQSQC